MAETGVIRRIVRYATASRFEPPRPVDTDGDRAVAPQPPSRLERIMGPAPSGHPQREDCLNLAVTTPGMDDAARPVIVWLHGGGFSSGGGVLEWYDGGKLAAEGDVVVVCPNHRLGALGYLRREGISDGNLGLLDQLAALRWVREHIARFGGDPDNVTVAGQSAGALSIRLFLELPSARGLFHRAVLESGPLGAEASSEPEAVRTGELFADALGEDPRTASMSAIVAAQRKTMLAHAERSSGFLPPFRPVRDVGPFGGGASWQDNVRGLDVLHGYNRDDMSAFGYTGADAVTATEQVYAEPLGEFTAQLSAAGARAFGYRLDWRPEGSPFGATHCLEIPLLLGGEQAWRGSPMLGSTPWSEVESFGTALRTAWHTFARTGTPEAGPSSAWPVTWFGPGNS